MCSVFALFCVIYLLIYVEFWYDKPDLFDGVKSMQQCLKEKYLVKFCYM